MSSGQVWSVPNRRSAGFRFPNKTGFFTSGPLKLTVLAYEQSELESSLSETGVGLIILLNVCRKLVQQFVQQLKKFEFPQQF